MELSPEQSPAPCRQHPRAGTAQSPAFTESPVSESGTALAFLLRPSLFPCLLSLSRVLLGWVGQGSQEAWLGAERALQLCACAWGLALPCPREGSWNDVGSGREPSAALPGVSLGAQGAGHTSEQQGSLWDCLQSCCSHSSATATLTVQKKSIFQMILHPQQWLRFRMQV